MWELASTGRRPGCLEIVRFFNNNPLSCISVASHAFFDINRNRNPQKAKVTSARVVVKVYDTDLDAVLESSDAVNGESGVQLRPISDDSEYDSRFRLLWLPGKDRDETIVTARKLTRDVATPKGIYQSRSGMWAIRFRREEDDAAHKQLLPNTKLRPYVEVKKRWKLIGVPLGCTRTDGKST